MNIGENIKKVRKEQNATQEEFAKKLEISRSYLSDIENNRKNISTNTLRNISEKLNVSINYLTTGVKTVGDLTEKEINEQFKEQSDFLNQDIMTKIGIIKSELNLLNENNLSIIEVQYLFNSFKFLKVATNDEINRIQLILNQLVKFKKKHYNKDEIDKNQLYKELANYFNKFLNKYLDMNV